MPDTAMRLAAVAAAMSNAELSEFLISLSECSDVTPEQRAALDEAVLRLKAHRIGESDQSRTHDVS